MDEVSIVQICKSNFKEDEVCRSKALLFQVLDRTSQMPSRRRDDGEKSLQDIITLFKETDPDDVPDFVAKDLHKLPPVGFDHVDVTRLLKDINFLKTSLAEVVLKLEASDNTISELRSEVSSLRSLSTLSRSPVASNINIRRGAHNASVGSFESAEFADTIASPAADVGAAASASPRPAPPSPHPAPLASPAPRPAAPAAAPRRATAAAANAEKPPRVTGPAFPRGYAEVAAVQPAKPSHTAPKTKSLKVQEDREGFIKVERKKKKPFCQNKCGTAPNKENLLLRAEVPTTQLYVSRVHHAFTAKDVVEYLHAKTGLNMRVERLESRHRSKLNCEVLYDELAFEVRWAVAGDSIVLQLVGKLEDNDYMAFGISGDSVHSQMVGGDVAVAWVNKETLKGYVFDYFLDSKSQCAGVRGSCPDEALGAKTNSVRLLNAALVNGYSIVTYQRSLKAADGLDQNIYTNMSQPIIWALGPLNSKNEVSYHHHFNKGDRLIDFGRAPVWNCPMPEGEDGPVDQYHGQKQQQQQVQKNPDPKPVEHYQTHEIKPNPVPAPKPVPKVVPWEIPPIQCYEPADGVLYAQMGPTGGKQGYSAITGHVGWGISWYINGLLIPEINVVRGKKYTFVVEGGTDPEVPAKYHPFYITDDPVGGYFHKTPAEKQKVNIYAGVRRTRTGELIPTGVGRLCNWTPDTQGPEADEFPSFGAYQRSLTLVCDPGNPGVVHWIPDRNTPDTVYYQCFTHRHLGWKINVVDSCEVQDPEESRVVDVFEQPDQRQEESLQVESRINSNSNFLDQHKKVEKIINTNKSNYDNFSSNKAGNYGGQESIQPFSNAQKYELPVSKGQIKHVIEAVESIESQMQNEARKNLTNLAHNQYLVHENNNEQSLFEQPIVDNEEYIIEHPKAPGSHFLPANYKPHTLQSVLRTNGQRPVGPIRPPNRRPTPPEIKLRRPNPPPSFHEGYNNRNNFFTPHNQNHNYVYPQKKTHPQKYPSRVQPPNYHSMHSKPNPQNKNNMSPYNQPPGHFPYKAPHKPINPPLKMMGMPPYKLNPGPVNQNQNVNKGDPEIIANQVVKSQILLPGANDAEVQQSVQSQSYINRPDQIILGKPIENPTPLDQHMVPNKQYNIQSAPITPPPRPRYQTTTPKIENIENIPIPNSNSDQPEIQSSDFLGHQVETSSFSPAVNTGFKPDTVVIESGFKPIIREPLMDRTDGYAVEDERHGDEKQNGESFSNNLKNPQRRVDADIEDYVEAAPQHLTNTNFNSNNKVTETFEPMFMPSPEDHSLNTELNTEKTKEVFPLNHAKEDRPHPVYTPTKKPEGINLFSEKKNENEMPSDMLMDSDKISPQYLPPEVPKDHTPHNSKAEETYTTYDGKTVSAATLTSVPEVNNYDDEFFSWKLPANSEKLLKSPQLGPFRGEIPPSSDMFLEDEAMSGQNDRFKLEASSDVKTSKNDKEQHKLMKRDEDILAELRKLVESDDNEEISDSDYEEEEGKRRKREVQTAQYEKNYESTTSTTQQSFTNGHMHHTEYESTNRSTIRTSQLYLVLLVLGMRYI